MDKHSFYRSIFPAAGLIVLAVFRGGLKQAPTHFFYEDIDDFLEAASTYDKLKKNVYHACATYATDENRKSDNAAAVKALWIDLDVGPNKPYSTQRDAAAAALTFSDTLELATPWLVSSGNGVHAYWPLFEAVSPDEWHPLAARLAQCLNHAGVKHDTSRTQDIASILRIPTTHNYKTDPPREVKILKAGVEDTAEAIFAKLGKYLEYNNVVWVGPPESKKPIVSNDLIGNISYPPAFAENLEKFCPVIKEVAETGGDVSFDVWRSALGVAKHLEQPEEAAIRWTRNRAATDHDKFDWQKETATWDAGPTTCETFSKHSDKCKACPHWGKIKSPIQLGPNELPEPAPVVPPPKPAVQPWTFGARWIMDAMKQHKKYTVLNDGSLVKDDGKDENGKLVVTRISNRYWQVLRRVRAPDSTYMLEIGYSSHNKRGYDTFLLESLAVSSSDLLRKTFSAYEIHFLGTRAMQHAQDLLNWQQQQLFDYRLDTPTFPTMGWTTENHSLAGQLTGEFVLGTTIFRPKQPPSEVLMIDQISDELIGAYTQAGTKEDWIRLVNYIYNRPGAQAYQFIILAAFAAPLVKLTPGEGVWHGIPIALCGDSGAAKTTTAKVAMTVYGHPAPVTFNANASKEGGQGDTTNALAIKMGTLSNLPFILDEITGVDPEKMSALMYMIPNGKIKDRATRTGDKLVDNKYRWDTLSFITGNEELHEKLGALRNQNAKEATQLRCFQVVLREEDLRAIFTDISRTTIEVDLLSKQYGTVGRDWLQWLVNNRVAVAELLNQTRSNYQISDDDSSAIRFYKDLLVCVDVAARLAKRRGYIQFDIEAMMTWARRQLGTLRDSVLNKDWDGVISNFFASLHGRTIVTGKFPIAVSKRNPVSEVLRATLSTNAEPLARRAVDDRVFVVVASAVADWANEKSLSAKRLIDEMEARGFINYEPGQSRDNLPKVNIGIGTIATRPQSPCFFFDYDKVADYSEYAEELAQRDMTNVVPLPVAQKEAPGYLTTSTGAKP